jgi:hypothetical protein
LNLLWRDSRDDFTAQEFHRRCDGRANILTLIADTDTNLFGGFTPMKWESPDNQKYKGYDSLWSFLLTLRNPHGIPPRKFALRAEMKQDAICCYSAFCAAFGGSCDILICDDCKANGYSSTHIRIRWSDRAYANDTAFADFFTGVEKFTVKEIEVFEIAN